MQIRQAFGLPEQLNHMVGQQASNAIPPSLEAQYPFVIRALNCIIAEGTSSRDGAHLNSFIATIKEIPSFLIGKNDPRWPWHCKISGQPIRFIVVPNFSDEQLISHPDLAAAMYEKNAWEKWKTENPGMSPPGCCIRPEAMVPDRRMQAAINKALKDAIDELCSILRAMLELKIQQSLSPPIENSVKGRPPSSLQASIRRILKDGLRTLQLALSKIGT